LFDRRAKADLRILRTLAAKTPLERKIKIERVTGSAKDQEGQNDFHGEKTIFFSAGDCFAPLRPKTPPRTQKTPCADRLVDACGIVEMIVN
jgi:hypothetical protein